MIAKQFLITGGLMGFIGIIMSVIFRLQLGWDGEPFPFLETFMGEWAPDGILDPDKYLALVTMHGTIMVFFLLTALLIAS